MYPIVSLCNKVRGAWQKKFLIKHGAWRQNLVILVDLLEETG